MGRALTARKKQNTRVARIAKAILEEYQARTKEEMQDAVKDVFGPMFEAMLQGEMNGHLGYEANEHGHKNTANRRNGYDSKNIKTSYGEIPIDVPRDREGNFEPKLIPKGSKDVSGIEDKVLEELNERQNRPLKKFYTFLFVDCM